SRGRTVTQNTDVAVLPGLYLELGDALFERLVGNFAIAVWDPRSRRVVLGRDRAGERHLLYRRSRDRVLFSSELAALTAGVPAPLQRDTGALCDFIVDGFFAVPRTPYRDVSKLAPGECVVIDAGGERRRRYWRWNMGVAKTRAPDEQRFDEIFRRAVRRQTDVDVDFGILLSGGIDSSLIAAVSRQVRPDARPTAYTVRFRESSYDEGGPADEVAASLGLRCEPAWLSAEEVPDILEEMVRVTGEPIADPALIPHTHLCRRAARDVRLVLGGEGADELFGGYPTHLGAVCAGVYSHTPGFVRRPFESIVRRWPVSDRKVTLSFLLKRFIAGVDLDGVVRHRLWTSVLSPETLASLGLGQANGAAGSLAVEDLPGGVLDRVQRYDFEGPLAERLLIKADRGGMLSGLELRAPFLDRDVIEFAAALPPGARVSRLQTKVFLKRYARRYLPRSITHRRKRGLSVPIASWLRGPLQDWARDRLANSGLGDIGIREDRALALLDAHLARTEDYSRGLWTLLVVAEWLRTTAAAVSSERPAGVIPAAAAPGRAAR
ncbi:MAG TPA: asparagine synthase-related protein, partial [Gammaproteobacteria bacterium]|nr:asparagine synthase-related protein [Gammaproteobacteria bacterium]